MSKTLATLFVLIVVGIAVGYFLKWFSFRANREDQASGNLTLRMDVNTDKIEGDTASVKDKVKELAESIRTRVGSAADSTTVTGKIVKLDADGQRFHVETAAKEVLAIRVESSSKVQSNGKSLPFAELRVGDQVTAVHEAKEGILIARTITVERGR